MKRTHLIGVGLAVLLASTGCNDNTPRDTWIDTHPTHAGPNGECIEADGEPCDEDPFDLDDLFESDGKPKLPTVKPKPRQSTRPPIIVPQPKPTPKRTR